MVDDVLRMRATIVSDQALAQIRTIGRELGLVPQKAAPGIRTLTTEFTRLSQSVQKVGNELKGAFPALGGIGFGAASAGLALGGLMRSLTNISGRLVELRYASKELGMSERDIRAWSLAAEKAGISSESMVQGLESFKKTTDGLRYNIGGVRSELYQMGAGPVVQRMMAATTQAEKLKIAFDFKDVLMKSDPTGFKARKWFDDIGLGADKARLSLDEFVKAQAKVRVPTAAEIQQTIKFNDAWIDLKDTMVQLGERAGIKLFPFLSQELEKFGRDLANLEKEIQGYIETWNNWTKVIQNAWKWATGQGGQPSSQSYLPPSQQRMPRTPAESLAMGMSPVSFGQGGGLSDASRMVKEGVFAALVEFQSYVTTGQAAGGGGFTPAAFGGSAGAATGDGVGGRAGGWGGGGYTNLTPGTGGGTAGGAPAPAGGGIVGDGVAGQPGGPKQNLTPGSGGAAGGKQAALPPPGAALPTAPQGPSSDRPVGQRPVNYFQRRGDQPLEASQLATVDTPYGKVPAHPEAAQDFGKFASAMKEAGAPIQSFGGYSKRMKRAWLGGKGWSSHAYGAAWDIDNKATLSPQMKQWIKDNPEKFQAALAAGNMRQPLPDTDAPHIEWTGPSGEKNPVAASKNAGPSAAGGSAADRKVVKGSWFGGGAAGWPGDLSEPASRPTAGGFKNTMPGIALPKSYGKPTGQLYEVTGPDGKTMVLPHIDTGPHPRTGRGIDITAAGAAAMGYSPKTFPTDRQFSYRRVDQAVDTAATGGTKVDGSVAVNITSNGTAARASASTNGDLFQKSTVTQHKQMQPTDKPETASIEAD
ncbi:hypothetical protein I6F35_06315 [Bradyrhizobium sp. BRP22]|uniref:hypothetical protein n=1 Tax=Bradyrhizobium sp. BRP22 TaxID=2793821 RepID=UPI001CD4626E|nr:hypothetical protein [Bradyrhizobium sp. BRP22]MCA1452834.1 hypothetical protein [Bradyrhizobium sp. BRP22]